MRLKDCGPLKIVVPGRANVRRRNIEIYLQTHGVEVADMIEMDAMIGTLQFVARSDWVAILSGLICVTDIGRNERVISPIYDPPLFAEFVVIYAGAAHAVDAGPALPRNASKPRSSASRRSGRG